MFSEILNFFRKGNRLLYLSLIAAFFIIFVFDITDIFLLSVVVFAVLIGVGDSEFFRGIRERIVNFFKNLN